MLYNVLATNWAPSISGIGRTRDYYFQSRAVRVNGKATYRDHGTLNTAVAGCFGVVQLFGILELESTVVASESHLPTCVHIARLRHCNGLALYVLQESTAPGTRPSETLFLPLHCRKGATHGHSGVLRL